MINNQPQSVMSANFLESILFQGKPNHLKEDKMESNHQEFDEIFASLWKEIETNTDQDIYCPELESLSSILATSINNRSYDVRNNFRAMRNKFTSSIIRSERKNEIDKINLLQRAFCEISALDDLIQKISMSQEQVYSLKEQLIKRKQPGLINVFKCVYDNKGNTITTGFIFKKLKENSAYKLSRQQIRNNIYSLTDLGVITIKKETEVLNSQLLVNITYVGLQIGDEVFSSYKQQENIKPNKPNVLEKPSNVDDWNNVIVFSDKYNLNPAMPGGNSATQETPQRLN